jgi:hypothetical protein
MGRDFMAFRDVHKLGSGVRRKHLCWDVAVDYGGYGSILQIFSLYSSFP